MGRRVRGGYTSTPCSASARPSPRPTAQSHSHERTWRHGYYDGLTKLRRSLAHHLLKLQILVLGLPLRGEIIAVLIIATGSICAVELDFVFAGAIPIAELTKWLPSFCL